MTTGANPVRIDETGAIPAHAAMRLHELRATDAAAIRTVRDRNARGLDVTRDELQAATDALARDEVRAAGGLTAAVSTLPPAPKPRRYSSTYEESITGNERGPAVARPATEEQRDLYALEQDLAALERALR